MFYPKQKQRIIKYRDYKNFISVTCRMDLLKDFHNIHKGDFDKFKFLIKSLLESHAPMKEKNIWHNQAPFMNKSVRKDIKVQIRLLNNFSKEDSFINEIVYKR